MVKKTDAVDEAEEQAPVEEKPDPVKVAIEKLETWKQETVHNTVISQDTSKYNKISELVRQLQNLIQS